MRTKRIALWTGATCGALFLGSVSGVLHGDEQAAHKNPRLENLVGPMSAFTVAESQYCLMTITSSNLLYLACSATAAMATISASLPSKSVFTRIVRFTAPSVAPAVNVTGIK